MFLHDFGDIPFKPEIFCQLTDDIFCHHLPNFYVTTHSCRLDASNISVSMHSRYEKCLNNSCALNLIVI